jgi:hypothetical protein
MLDWLLSRGDALAHWTVNAVANNAATLTIDLLLTGLVFYPLCNFLHYGWARKADEVQASMSEKGQQTYFKLFFDQDVSSNVKAEFRKLYQRSYGRGRFLPAVVLVLVIAALQNFYLGQVLAKLLSSNPASADISSDWRAVPAAIAGAHMFVAWDFIARVQRRSLTPADILRGALRLALAVPLGLAFSMLQPDVAVLLAFGIGVFPFETIATMLRRLVNERLKLQIGAAEADGQIGKLDGVDREIADRIADADITTIAQLAWCDPVQLVMRTNLSFDYVVDIVSQALAWVYLDKKLNDLRPYGLRGAYEVKVMLDDLASTDPKDAVNKARAAAALPLAAAAIMMTPDGVMYAFMQIAEDGMTQFLYDTSTS